MPKVTLPDGSSRDYSQAISIFDVASDIGPGLAKALAGRWTGAGRYLLYNKKRCRTCDRHL